MKLNMIKYGTTHPMTFEISRYADNGNLYVGLITHEEGFPMPWQNLTVNLDMKCEDNCAFIDVNNNGREIVEWLIANQLGNLTGWMRHSGFCMYPEFKFDMQKLKQYIE